MGRGAYTMVCKWKVMVDDPRTELRLFRVIPDGCNQKLWHKCTTFVECQTYSNSRVHGYGRLERPYWSVVRCFLKINGELKGEFDLITTELWE